MAEVSVVIPTLRRYGQLARVLDALEPQEVAPASCEVIVASDAQEEDGARVATAIGRRADRGPGEAVAAGNRPPVTAGADPV